MQTETNESYYKRIKEKLDSAVKMVNESRSFADIREAFGIYNEAYIEVSSRYARLFLKMYHDVTCQESMTQLMSNVEYLDELVHYAPFGSAVLASPYYNDIIDYYGKPAIRLLKFNVECDNAKKEHDMTPPSIDEATMKYQNLIVQANGIYEKYADEFDSILQEIVEKNHKVALYYGYQNYCDYANQMYSRFDYGEEEIMKLCEQVRRKVVPYYETFKDKYSEQLKQSKPTTKKLHEGMAVYTKQLGAEAVGYWESLCENDALDIDTSPVKMPNMAIQRFIEEDKVGPIILNPTGSFSDGWMLAHEFGHSFQEYLAFMNQESALNVIASADLMEISSRLLELFLHVHAPSMYDDAHNFGVFHLDSILRSTINFAMSTEYEHWLYHNVDASKAQRREKYNSLFKETHPSTMVDETIILRKLYDETTVFTMPKYQFCYVLAWINAVEIAKDYNIHPVETYKKFIDLSSNLAFYGYKELIDKYNLYNVFENESIEQFLNWIEELVVCDGYRTETSEKQR